MKFKLNICLSVFCLFAIVPLFAAGNLVQGFYAGNSYYEKGEYDKAIVEYEKIISTGRSSGPLYFNLGNAYFKQGQIGKAIINYERARRLIPRDRDLQANYEYAARLVKYGDGLTSVYFTLDELCLAAAAIFLLLVVLLFLRRYYSFFVFLLVFCFVVSVLWRSADKMNKEAVICSETASVNFEPRKDATVYYSLYEGMKVQIVSTDGDWSKVKRRDGKMGWVESGAVELI